MFKIIHKNKMGCLISEMMDEETTFDDEADANDILVKYLLINEFYIGDTITIVKSDD